MLGKTSQISFIYLGHFHSSQILLKRVYSGHPLSSVNYKLITNSSTKKKYREQVEHSSVHRIDQYSKITPWTVRQIN